VAPLSWETAKPYLLLEAYRFPCLSNWIHRSFSNPVFPTRTQVELFFPADEEDDDDEDEDEEEEFELGPPPHATPKARDAATNNNMGRLFMAGVRILILRLVDCGAALPLFSTCLRVHVYGAGELRRNVPSRGNVDAENSRWDVGDLVQIRLQNWSPWATTGGGRECQNLRGLLEGLTKGKILQVI
jgi:hypothetical protein